MNEAILLNAVYTAAARTAIEKIVVALKKATKREIDSQLVLARLQTQAERISKVKTLLSTETHVRIEDFYCSPRITFGEKRFVPNNATDFHYEQVLVEGMAGQGKSILLRYLCATSILRYGRIALFYELRKLDDLTALTRVVMNDLEELGLPANSEALKTLSLEKGLEVYLDGFDEIDEKKALKIDRDVEYFSKTYPFIQLFVSSRPHVGLARNPTFYAFKIEPLNEADVKRLVEKLCDVPEVARDLNAKISAHRGRVMDLLETPLLVTLLVAQYKQTQQIPEQLSDFYESIFLVLFERHDSFKAPYNRPKKLKLSTSAYKRAFQRFCYASLFVRKLDSDASLTIAAWALGVEKNCQDAQDFLTDISVVSSLIIEEDGFWSFIHNSVQEYYAAAFLMSGSDRDLEVNAKAFYTRAEGGRSIDQVFGFCKEIDEFRFSKFVQLPYCTYLAGDIHLDEEIGDEKIIDWICRSIAKIEETGPGHDGSFFSLVFKGTRSKPITIFVAQADVQVRSGLQKMAGDISLVAGIRDLPVVMKRIRAQILPIFEELQAKIGETQSLISRQEREREDMGAFLQGLSDD